MGKIARVVGVFGVLSKVEDANVEIVDGKCVSVFLLVWRLSGGEAAVKRLPEPYRCPERAFVTSSGTERTAMFIHLSGLLTGLMKTIDQGNRSRKLYATYFVITILASTICLLTSATGRSRLIALHVTSATDDADHCGQQGLASSLGDTACQPVVCYY